MMKCLPMSVDPQLAQREAPLIDALRRGDTRAAVEGMMRLYGQPIYRFCLSFLNNPEMAEEVHQTVFIQAYRDAGRFSGGSSLKSWLYAIARHRCLDAVKIKRRRDKRFDAPGDLPETGDQRPSPEEQVAAASLAGPLKRCLDQLAPHVRSAVLLRHQEGLSYADMAAALGEKAGTIQARVARALPALRACLRSEGAR